MAKRLFDFLIAVFFLLILSPFFLIIAILIFASSKGPVFYRQSRVGLRNKDFKIIKFRSMYVASDQSSLITIGNRDPRITGVGYFLRKYKIDELPQLINVFLGEMSLVGPRPEVKKYVELYDAEQLRVLNVRPGITDYASLKYFNENEVLAKADNPDKEYTEVIMPLKLRLNLQYIKERNFFTDIRILFKTVLRIAGLIGKE